MSRPTPNREVYEQIASSLDGLERGELVNLLSHFIKTYVVDGTMPFSLPGADDEYARRQAEGTLEELEESPSFTKVIRQLKKRLDLDQLRYFGIEDDQVTIRVDNQKITFGEDQVTMEFVPVSSPPPGASSGGESGSSAPGGSRPAEEGPSSSPGPAGSSSGDASSSSEDEEALSETEQEALNDIMQRVKKLDLD